MERAPASTKLLLVDDDEDFLELLSMQLSSRYQLSLARDGEEALTKVAEERPDMVLLDVMMPRLGGWSVCWTLKNHEEYGKIPILFLTAVTATDKIRQQLSRADGYLIKPFETNELLAKIEEILSQPR